MYVARLSILLCPYSLTEISRRFRSWLSFKIRPILFKCHLPFWGLHNYLKILQGTAELPFKSLLIGTNKGSSFSGLCIFLLVGNGAPGIKLQNFSSKQNIGATCPSPSWRIPTVQKGPNHPSVQVLAFAHCTVGVCMPHALALESFP